MSKHYAPQASSYTDEGFIARAAEVYCNGGNHEGMFNTLNAHDRATFWSMVQQGQARVQVQKAALVNQRAHEVLARLLGEAV